MVLKFGKDVLDRENADNNTKSLYFSQFKYISSYYRAIEKHKTTCKNFMLTIVSQEKEAVFPSRTLGRA